MLENSERASCVDSQRYSYRTIAEGSDTLFLGQCPAINNFGAVAFSASELDPETSDLDDSVLRGAGGPLTMIADESDGFTSISGNPTIDDLGAAVRQLHGRRVAQQPRPRRVHRVRRRLHPRGGLHGPRRRVEMLNARGQVAVKVTFDDFSEAIVRATPRP